MVNDAPVAPKTGAESLNHCRDMGICPATVAVNVALEPTVTLRLCGPRAMTGAPMRRTVTENEQMLLPQAFVAVQATMVVPSGKTLPLAGTQLLKDPLVTVGLAKLTTTFVPLMFVRILARHDTTTAGRCSTTTLNVHVLV